LIFRCGVKLWAERRMGELLTKTERAKGGRVQSTGNTTLPVETEPTLSELGLSKRESAEAQMLASLPDETFEAVENGDKSIAQVRREKRKAEALANATHLPSEKYRVLYADPPWRYDDKCDAGAIQAGGAEKHYPAMSIADLCALSIADLCDDDAVLFLWTTSPMLEVAFTVIKAWGFAYKTSFVWDKVKHNMGHYNSVRHEFLLVCTRGSCTPDVKKLFDSVVVCERSKTHSEKPTIFREMIDTLYPNGRRLELFARVRTENWDAWGAEA